MERRKVLAALGGSAAVALAGCSNGGDDTNNSTDGNNSTNGNNTNGTDVEAPDAGEFTAESVEGIVWFGEPDKQKAMEDALALPPQEDAPAPVVLEASVNDDGTWESDNIEFPPLSGLPIPETPTVETPGGFEGELDLEEGRWTVEGQLRVIIPQEEEDLTLEFPLNATTGESGDLTGSFERDGDTGTATIVDNETPVNSSTGDPIIDQLLGLDGPAGNSGSNWFSLTMDMTFGDLS